MDAADAERAARESALNGLETYIYKCKELSYDDDFEDIATEKEQADLKVAISAASDWFDDHTDKTTKSDFTKEKENLQKHASQLFRRRREISMRPVAVEKLREEIKAAQEVLDGYKLKLNETEVAEDEFKGFVEQIEAESKWLEESVV